MGDSAQNGCDPLVEERESRQLGEDEESSPRPNRRDAHLNNHLPRHDDPSCEVHDDDCAFAANGHDNGDLSSPPAGKRRAAHHHHEEGDEMVDEEDDRVPNLPAEANSHGKQRERQSSGSSQGRGAGDSHRFDNDGDVNLRSRASRCPACTHIKNNAEEAPFFEYSSPAHREHHPTSPTHRTARRSASDGFKTSGRHRYDSSDSEAASPYGSRTGLSKGSGDSGAGGSGGGGGGSGHRQRRVSSESDGRQTPVSRKRSDGATRRSGGDSSRPETPLSHGSASRSKNFGSSNSVDRPHTPLSRRSSTSSDRPQTPSLSRKTSNPERSQTPQLSRKPSSSDRPTTPQISRKTSSSDRPHTPLSRRSSSNADSRPQTPSLSGRNSVGAAGRPQTPQLSRKTSSERLHAAASRKDSAGSRPQTPLSRQLSGSDRPHTPVGRKDSRSDLSRSGSSRKTSSSQDKPWSAGLRQSTDTPRPGSSRKSLDGSGAKSKRRSVHRQNSQGQEVGGFRRPPSRQDSCSSLESGQPGRPGRRESTLDLAKLLAQHAANAQAKSEDEVQTEKAWLDAERVWLVHKGGFAAAFLQKTPGLAEGKVSIKLEGSGEVLEVDEEDVEKTNPPQFDTAEDLAALRYLNESSVLHTLRQRYGSDKVHTYAGPSLIVINPTQPSNAYHDKVIPVLKGCRQEDMFPHVFSMAQIAHRDMLSMRRDQSIVLMGRSGSGKTTASRHILQFYAVAWGGTNNILTMEKLNAMNTLLEAFGNSRTLLNTNASRYTQITTLDFDHSGQVASVTVQALMFEKMRVVRRPEGEPTFNIFYHLLAGVDSQLRNELQLQSLNEPNTFFTPLQKPEDRQRAAHNWGRILAAFEAISSTAEEAKAIFCVLAAIYHLGVAGAVKGPNNKAQFGKPAAAQKAAALLGTTVEELARSMFAVSGSTSTLSRSTSVRLAPGADAKSGYVAGDVNTTPTEALEAFVIGLYSDVFSAVVSLINRSLASNLRTAFSITVVDSPGFQNPASMGRQTGASFEDLCNNYTHERLQLFFHDLTFTQQQDRYAQENVDCDFEFVTTSPAAMVELIDKPSQQSLVRSSHAEMRDAEKKGLLWILDDEAIFPGASEDSFMDRLFAHHGDHPVRRDSLLRKGSLGTTFILNHFQGTSPVQYNAAGWLKTSRENPISKNATVLLQESKKMYISSLFLSCKSAAVGLVSGSISGMEGTTSLRRVGSMRRTFMSGTAGLKKRSVCLQVKFQVDSLVDILRKTKCHFVHCLLPQTNAGLCELKAATGQKPTSQEDALINVPLLRSQIRGMEILDALRIYRQGFPDHVQFSEVLHKFEVLVSPNSRPSKTLEEEQKVRMLMDHLDIDKLNYRLGLSQVFFRPGALAQLETQRDEKVTDKVVEFQACCRGFLGRKLLQKRRVQHMAIRCIQRNVKKYMSIRDWPWWRLYTKVKPILNVHRTEEELQQKELELEQTKTKLEKVEKEKNELKAKCDRLESRLTELTADLADENTTSSQATELLEAETAERMRLEKELKELQGKHNILKRQCEKMEMEVMQSRLWTAQAMDGELEDDTEETDSVYKERYDRLRRDFDLTRRRTQQQHEEEMEHELQVRKTTEKKLHEAVEDAEEQRRQLQVAKRKAQRLTSEMADLKLHLEEQMARNNELERKQRRFDSELNMAQEDVKEERALREKIQKERDNLLSEKYSSEQEIQRLKMDLESQMERVERQDRELKDLLSSGKDNNEAMALKRAKHELELKLREQEEELDDQAGQIQQLEQAKLRLEMNVEKTKQQHAKELDERDEEMEELRCKTQKKLRQLESQVEEEYEEKKRLMEEKKELERKIQELGAAGPSRDKETEKRLRRNLKKTKALLRDASTMLDKQKQGDGGKTHAVQLRDKLDDVEFAATSAAKAKKRMEIELQEMQQQLEDMSRAKAESENKVMVLMREKADLQTQLEDMEEELSETIKKFKAAVSQQSVDQITLADQLTQLEELTQERDTLRQQVSELQSKVTSLEELTVDKHAVLRLENRIRDLDSRLQLEQTQRQRVEAQLSRQKEHQDKLSEAMENANQAKLLAEEGVKRMQKQLRELREELADAQKKELDASQAKKQLESRVEELEYSYEQGQVDLKLAFKRINDLQAALEEDVDSDDSLILDSDLDDEDDDDDDDEDFQTYLENHTSGFSRHSTSGPRSSGRTRSTGNSTAILAETGASE